MDDKTCDLLNEFDEYFNNEGVNERKFNKFKECHSYCPYQNTSKKNICTNNYERINALGSYLFTRIMEIDKAFKGLTGDKRHIEVFMIWLGDKLFRIDKDYKATLEEYYKNNLENIMGNANYWEAISKKLYKNATIKKMSDYYRLLNYICKLITEYNKNPLKPNKSRIGTYSIQCNNNYKAIHNSINECKPYLQLLDSLKMIYENFKLFNMNINSKLKGKEKDLLLNRVQPLTTFKGVNRYFVTVTANISFDDKECKDVKLEDEKIGERIVSQKPQGKLQDARRHNKPNTEPQTQSSSSTLQGKPKPSKPKTPLSMLKIPPNSQPNPQAPGSAQQTRPIKPQASQPPSTLQKKVQQPSTPQKKVQSSSKPTETPPTPSTSPGLPPPASPASPPSGSLLSQNGPELKKPQTGGTNHSNDPKDLGNSKGSKSGAPDGGLGSSSKTQAGSDIGTGSPGGEPGGAAGGKGGSNSNIGVKNSESDVSGGRTSSGASGGAGGGNGGGSTQGDQGKPSGGTGSVQDGQGKSPGETGGYVDKVSQTKDPGDPSPGNPVPAQSAPAPSGTDTSSSPGASQPAPQPVQQPVSPPDPHKSGPSPQQGPPQPPPPISQNDSSSQKSQTGGSGGGKENPGGGSSDSASNTSEGSFNLGLSIFEFLLNGTKKLNKASEFIKDNQEKFKNVAEKISGTYNKAKDKLKTTYDESNKYLNQIIKDVFDQFNKNDTPSKSNDKQPDPGSPIDGGKQSNQSPSAPPINPPPQTPTLNLPSPTPTKDPPPNQASIPPIDPTSQKQSSSQHKPITQDLTQVNQPNHQKIGQLVKSISSNQNLKKTWNIFPTTWNGSNDCKPEINFMNATLVCCTSKQCSLTGISVTLVLIPIILLIAYKCLSFGSSKKSEKKNMKKVINFHDGNRKTKIIISSNDKKKKLKPIINSIGGKRSPLLNIYKLIQADSMPFINLFFLLIFFVYKRKRDTIE
ncbi:PIR protein CIR protein [Plasmodium vinckei vinckei]|uniref:PIR protein CIR protein n=1 Tax=Plasmodium vinckei vinckei TaxID=54757 RepID=A0A449BS01_PLAVN|nr:PIR protein CIR protein [Plasmodium vinckei vinckei]VEV56188.1 PIR protein CIR protein [Plasmodium vinckei vinckei]